MLHTSDNVTTAKILIMCNMCNVMDALKAYLTMNQVLIFLFVCLLQRSDVELSHHSNITIVPVKSRELEHL